jgi:mono/diheme cytochrome c family protein
MPLCRVVWFVAWLLAALGAVPRPAPANEQGRSLYVRYCASCHGPEGRGDGADAPLLAQPPRNLRDGVLQSVPVTELVARIRTGGSLPLALSPRARAEVEQRTEAILAHLRALARANWAAVERGWALYLARCSSCHGERGEPPRELPAGVRRPRNLASEEFQRSISDAELVQVVRHGRQGMPALVPRIDDSEARALRSFVRLLSPGFVAYQQLCASCHGDDGRGVREPLGSVEQRPQVVFDRRYFEQHPPAEIRERIRHMLREKASRMPHFASVLSEEQVRAIVEYLRGLP